MRHIRSLIMLLTILCCALPYSNAHAADGWAQLSTTPVYTLDSSADGQVWSAEKNGFSRYEASGRLAAHLLWPHDQYGNPLANTSGLAISADSTTMLLGNTCCFAKTQSYESLVQFQGATANAIFINAVLDIGRSGERVFGRAIDRAGRPWLLTSTGLWAMTRGYTTPLDPADDFWSQQPDETSFIRIYGRTITAGLDGNIWLLVTPSTGIVFAYSYRANGSTLEAIDSNVGSFQASFTPKAIAVDSMNRPLFITDDNIYRLAQDSPGEALLQANQFGATIYDALEVGGVLWVATSNGLYRQGTAPEPNQAPVDYGALQPTPAYIIPPAPGIIMGEVGSIGRFADPALYWNRTDKPIIDGITSRSFIWGPQAAIIMREPYAEAAFGTRRVIYYDKARMEITNPAQALVTNGLLVVEMVTGQLQIGDTSFLNWQPAMMPVAGDPITLPETPSYHDFSKVIALSPGSATRRIGADVTASMTAHPDRQSGNGIVGNRPELKRKETRIAAYDSVTGHNIPRVFVDFMNRQGPVYANMNNVPHTERIIDPLLAMGHPISEAYWIRMKLKGEPTDALVQLFERRVLTYTPSNPAAYRVEMGNVGQHYYLWRYHGQFP